MQFIAWTLGFLLLFIALLSDRLQQFRITHATLALHQKKAEKMRETFRKTEEMGFEVLSSRQPSKESSFNRPTKPHHERSKLLYLDFPPYNAKLNLEKVFKEAKQEGPYFQIAIHLLERLYPGLAAKCFLKELARAAELKRKESKSKLMTHDLATLILDDSKMQDQLYLMLREEPSLLNYVIWEHHNKNQLSIHFVSFEILAAILQSEKAAAEIIAKRDEYYRGARTTRRGGLRVSEQYLLEDDVVHILASHRLVWEDYNNYFEFRVPKPEKPKFVSPLVAEARGLKKLNQRQGVK